MKKVRIFYREYENQYTPPRLSQACGAFTLCGMRPGASASPGVCHVTGRDGKFLAG